MHSSATGQLQINKTKYQLAKYFALASFGGIFLLSIASLQPLSFHESANAESQNVDVSVAIDPTISISTNVNSVSMNVAPNDLGSIVTSNAVTVNVGTNNPSGYTLSLSSDSSETALLKDGTSTTYTIPTLSSPTTSTTWASDNNLNNKWGFTHNNTDLLPTNTYLGVPASTTSGTTIKSTASPASSSETNVTFATKIDQTQPAGSYENTVVFSAVANNEPNTWMQDFTSTQCNQLDEWSYDSTTNTLHEGDTATLYDRRDGNAYKIRKLADHNCWMTQNLRLDLSTEITLTPEDTNITKNWTPENNTQMDNALIPWQSNLTTATEQDINQSRSYRVGSGLLGDYEPDNSIYGNYYNWYAATASAGTYSVTEQVNDSICPKRWRMPSSSGGQSWANLTNAYNLTSNAVSILAITNPPLDIVYAGFHSDIGNVDAINHQGQQANGTDHHARIWSNTAYSNTSARHMQVTDRNVINPDDRWGKAMGFSVRCLLSPE